MLADDMEGKAADLRVRVANLNGEALTALSVRGRLTLRLRLVFSDDVDATSIGPIVQQIDQTTGTEDPPVFEGRVAVHPIYDEAFCHRSIGPAEAPGVHRQ